MDALVADLGLPVGTYQLPDGRVFVGMNEFEVRAFCREAWRIQQIADFRLSLKLEALRGVNNG